MSAPDAGEDGVLVGRGGFTVDRAHALQKLKLYQLPKSVGGWLLWARCAAACGTREAQTQSSLYTFVLRFAGRPFTRAELSDPFAALFAGRAADRDRGFCLALGILAALDSGPTEVVVESGAGPERVRLTVRSLSDYVLEAAPAEEARTTLLVRWPLTGERRERFFNMSYASLRTAPPFYPERLLLTGGSAGVWPKEASAARAFRLGGAEGRLAPPPFYTPPDSHLHLFKLGVFVCEHRELLPWSKVQAWVNDDKLALSASQAGVVRDARFKGLMRLLAREASAMLRDAAQEHPALMERARTEMSRSADARNVWLTRMKWGALAGADALEPSWWRRLLAPGAARRFASYRVVLQAAERTLWLSDAAARLAAPGAAPPPGLAAAVQAALVGTERPV